MKQRIHFGVLLALIAGNMNDSRILKKIFLIMKLVAIILFIVNLQVSATSFGQNVSISKNNISLKDAFKELRSQTGYFFIYNNEVLSKIDPVDINVKDVTIEQALITLLNGQPLSFSIEDKIITVKSRPVSTTRNQQNRVITGHVVDSEDGLPLPGVSVRVKGTATQGVTNVDGDFKITIKAEDKVLMFAYLGYAVKEVPITAANAYPVTLQVQSTQLKEVVVAFGTSTKKELTYSVKEITAKDIEQRPISNLNNAIVGAAPGVQTSTGNGQPGEGPEIRIRGFSSISNSNNPLYVLDGAPYEGDINMINPDDIETISLLKDAASTALYGARAANGIVLITTKKGKKNRNTFSFKYTQAASERALPVYERVNAYQFYPLMWESMRADYAADFPRAPADSVNRLATNNIYSILRWNPFNVANNEIVLPDGTINPAARLLYEEDMSLKDAMERLGLRTDASVSLSGGSAKNDYYVSLAYLNEQGFSIGSDFKRYSTRLRMNSQPKKWLSTGFTLNGTYSESGRANENSGINENPFYVDLLMAPIYPVHLHDPFTGAYILDANGNKQYDPGDYRPSMTGRNILAETLYNINQIRKNAIIANTNVDMTFLKDFKFTTTFSANLNNYRSNVVDNSIIGDAQGRGRAVRTNNFYAYLNFNQLLNYTKKIGAHSIKALIGHESYLNYFDNLTGSATSQATSSSTAIDNYAVVTNLNGYDRLYKTEGYLSKVDYSYDGRYIASASFRTDGSSKFYKTNRWGKFYSVSGAWNIDQEAFFKVKQIDQLKIRASYGEVGNDNLGDYFAYQGLYGLSYNNGTEPGTLMTQIRVDSLEWETNINSDIAVEFSAFKNRISGSVEYYRRQTNNLLFDVAVPLSSGLTSRNDNFGSMLNQGIEVTLTGDIIRKKNFKWTTTVNWTTMGNKILTLPDSYDGLITGLRRYREGRSIYEFYVRDWRGVDPATGLDMYTPANTALITSGQVFTESGEVLTTTSSLARYRYAGSAIPDYFGSVNNTFSYKNFSLQLMFIYQVGGLVYDNDYQDLMTGGSSSAIALHVDALNAWKQPGDITDVPRRVLSNLAIPNSDRFLVDASYLHLKTAAFTYSLPKKVLSRFGMQAAKVYLNGENIFMTSKRKGLDPSQTYTGSSSYTYAPARIISLGLNLTL
ncbi:SusC/RagA family TonB-linked outer membrane protein [Pedobacter sp. MC2016-14]|uniref:SusC/RagA family TonB-linked outer membrane protein n=1 Tax=Pedobacter sp. MC2016-14 TaxID=2897327 RepID=UPI001E63BC08|nr:SusC/RagA family TonB-linked outer membrane protein [Pedobacter sp. MC2016-14]MCD0488587.1 SusC/RagA family TonB-linked outer membrane protein [Pedobacter sp. MC2016-14]